MYVPGDLYFSGRLCSEVEANESVLYEPKDRKPECNKGGVVLDRCWKIVGGRCARCGAERKR